MKNFLQFSAAFASRSNGPGIRESRSAIIQDTIIQLNRKLVCPIDSSNNFSQFGRADNHCYPSFLHHVIRSFNKAKFNNYCSKDYSNMFVSQAIQNATHAVPRFRGAHVSQSGAPKGDPYRFQCYNRIHFESCFLLLFLVFVKRYFIGRLKPSWLQSCFS